jgi:HEAT repeat protein
MTLVRYCWHCYTQNPESGATCVGCGRPVDAPPGASYVDSLLWALGHPLPERQMIAARVLGELREQRAAQTLREIASTSDDPYLAARALTSLVQIEGVEPLAELLEDRAANGAVPVREAARAALGR